MPALEPTWMRSDWLPKFDLLAWPGLTEMREEHARLIRADHAAGQSLAALEGRFAEEDEQMLAAERDAARSGKPAPEVSITSTPPLRRQAQLEAERERRSEAREALCNHVVLMVRESLAWQSEGEAALKAIVGRHASEPQDERDWNGRPAEEIENSPSRTAGISADRAALERDMRTFSTWFLTVLPGDGENVLQEVRDARDTALGAA